MSLGKFTGQTQHIFTDEDGRSSSVTIYEEIMFEECLANLRQHVDSIMVTTDKSEVKIVEKDSSIRFPLSSHISVGRELEI